ncbi:MAG: type II secretion system F family protein [Planctomycetaceae bacterium]|nr:type II secretion system F family protein [Planctomycetaceae bacterium]
MSVGVSVGVSASPNDLDRLIGLGEEISALVRTGLPLEESLLLISQSAHGEVARHLRGLAEQLGTGESLADAIRSDPVFPPVYAAVVESGIKSGNLSGALDSLTDCIRSLRDTRLFLLRATLYPLVLFTALWGVFAFLVLFVVPGFVSFFESFGKTFFMFDAVHALTSNIVTMWIFVLGVPVLVWGYYIVWTIQSAKSDVIQSVGNSALFRWLPWIGRAAIEMQKAAFARILAMLVRSSVPLDQAFLLAAKSCNERYWSQESLEALRRRIVEGKANAYPRSAVSPLIEWSLGIPDEQMLLEGVDHYAAMARTRASLLLTKCEMFLPATLTFFIAVLTGACYVLVVFAPYIQILHFMTEPLSWR